MAKDNKLEYYEKYLDICEQFIGGGISTGDARKRLETLNTEHAGASYIKAEVLGSSLGGYGDDGWCPSQVCW